MFMKFSNISKLVMGIAPVSLAFAVSVAQAGDVGVDVNIHLGNQPRPVVVAPQPVVVPPPVVNIEQDVDFVYPSQLGFYVAVGVPYDLFFIQGSYYIIRDGHWYRAPGSHGPWVAVRHRELPPGLRRHRLERIREYRNAEYDVYRRDRGHYHGRHFMTGKDEWKEQRKAEKEYRKELKHDEKEFRKEEKRADKEYRKEMKREEKEERKHHKHDRD